MALDSRKTFDKEHYKNNQACFDSLRKHFRYLYPHLLPENKQIDVAVYLDQKSFEAGHDPLFYLELEAKQHWKQPAFQYPTVHFLAKKQKYALLDKPAYWVLFNHDFTNVGFIDLTKIPIRYELDKIDVDRDYEFEYIYIIPQNDMRWGINHLERFIIFDAFRSKQKIHNL